MLPILLNIRLYCHHVAFKPSKQLAWCFKKSNIISMIELETHQRYANFQGVQLKNVNGMHLQSRSLFWSFSYLLVEEYEDDSWAHLKEIPNTGYLVSLHHCDEISANLAIFDVSQKTNPKKIYSFEEIVGGKYTEVYQSSVFCNITINFPW